MPDTARHTPEPARDKVKQAGDHAEQAAASPALKLLARAGFVAYGVVHLLIGWLALQIAWTGADGKSADPSGALRTLASQPFGSALLWLVAIGLTAMSLWQAGEAIWGHRWVESSKRAFQRAKSAARTVVYAALAFSAARVALGSATSSSKSQQAATSGLLDLPGGRIIVVVAGLVVIVAGLAHLAKGVKASFMDDLDTSSLKTEARQGVKRLGQLGYIAKGVALGLVGGLLVFATVSYDRQKTHGLDGAMQAVAEQPFGKFLLTAVAVGFMAFGVLAVLQSRYRRM